MEKQYQFNNACRDGDLKTVKLLINDPDVDPSGVLNYGIRWAARRGHKEVVELLMQDSRVDPSAFGNYAIRIAANRDHKDVVELFLTDKRVVDKIDVALERCKEDGGYELLKACVERHEKERRIQEAIEEMSADCELYF